MINKIFKKAIWFEDIEVFYNIKIQEEKDKEFVNSLKKY